MQGTLETTLAAVPRPHGRPILDSYDSSPESSLSHLLQLQRLVDEADLSDIDEELSCLTSNTATE